MTDEAPIPARLWSLSPEEEHGMHCFHSLYFCLPTTLRSLPEKARSFYYMNRFETVFLIILPVLL